MNVSVPISFPGMTGFAVSISGGSGGKAEVIIDGEGCSKRIIIPLDANGEGTAFVRAPCLGRSILLFARDGAGDTSTASTQSI